MFQALTDSLYKFIEGALQLKAWCNIFLYNIIQTAASLCIGVVSDLQSAPSTILLTRTFLPSLAVILSFPLSFRPTHWLTQDDVKRVRRRRALLIGGGTRDVNGRGTAPSLGIGQKRLHNLKLPGQRVSLHSRKGTDELVIFNTEFISQISPKNANKCWINTDLLIQH